MMLNCSSDDTTIGTEALMQEAIENAQTGTWKITSYIDSGKNETNDYVGYTFTFNENGSLTASNGTNTINGTWSVTKDSSDDNDLDFNISFASPPNFEELSDDWDIVSTSLSKIDLIDVSGGSGETDTLVFEKN